MVRNHSRDDEATEPTPDDLASLEVGDVIEVDLADGSTETLTVEDPNHPNLGGRSGNGQYSRYFTRDGDGKRVSLTAYHEDNNDKRRRDQTYRVYRWKTGEIMGGDRVDRVEVVDWRRPATDGGVDTGDVDRCAECDRYAAHTFDHAPSCPAHTPIEAEPDVEPTDLRHRDHDALAARMRAVQMSIPDAIVDGDDERRRRLEARARTIRDELVRRSTRRRQSYAGP